MAIYIYIYLSIPMLTSDYCYVMLCSLNKTWLARWTWDCCYRLTNPWWGWTFPHWFAKILHSCYEKSLPRAGRFGCVWKCCVPLNPMVLLIIIPFLNGYNWEYTLFSDKPIWGQWHWICECDLMWNLWQEPSQAAQAATKMKKTPWHHHCHSCNLQWYLPSQFQTVLP